ncbi:hypothetical protein CR162_18545 [Pseudoroseomonas rhizosphaerae]|uniref:Uncharacterized protein n=1 Tax=Teichococcus rhizosphaerae TaxID=1335062 RepID=A0A2C6XY56_9PROT|nr:hypothetical protein [Pseudoroseomonas rhizosphaerae]PHK93472.1 hypothetical protein CR162_18545 [Pseudoroseomonas rhizosphaerae]
MPRTATGRAQKDKTSLEAIRASSKTYNRCTAVLAEAVGIEPSSGQGPRSDFEMTVLRARQKLEAEVKHSLTEDDFAPSQLLQFMRRTAERLADAGAETITRDAFIREVIADLRERGGLVVKKISSTANSGHYAWIWSWMQTFLVRNQDIIARSTATELQLTRKVATAKKARKGQPREIVPDDFKWPPRSTLRFYRGERLVISSSDRLFDLSDELMGWNAPSPRKLTFGLSSLSTNATWRVWDEKALSLIEGLIRYDLTFDGYRVRIKRVSAPGSPCREEFRWSLDIKEA